MNERPPPGAGGGPAGPPRRAATLRRLALGVAGSAALVALITVASRIVGFGRVFVFAHTVGSGCAGGAYAVANLIPNVLFEVVAGGALAGVVVPVVAGLLGQGRREDADRALGALLGWAVLGLVPVAALVAVVAGPLTRPFLLGGEVCADGPDLARVMLVIFAPQIVLYGVGIVLSGALQAHGRFVWPALAPLLSSLVVIVAYLGYAALAGTERTSATFVPDGPELLLLAGGTTLGVVVLSLPLLWPVRRAGVHLRPGLRLPADVRGQVRTLALAGLGTLVAQQVAVLATIAIAGRVGGEGTLVAQQYVQAVYLLPYAVLAVPLATVVFPRISGRAAVGDRSGFAQTVAVSLRAVVTVGWVGAAGLVAVAPAVQRFFAAIDVVGAAALAEVAAATSAYAGGLVGFSVVALVMRALFATGHGRVAAWAVSTGWLASVAAASGLALLLRAGDVPGDRAALLGLGWGNTFGMTVAAVLVVVVLVRSAGAEAVRGGAAALLVGGAGAAAAAVAGRRVTDTLLGQGPATGPTGPVTAGLVGGLVALLVLLVVAGPAQRELPRRLARMRTGADGREVPDPVPGEGAV